MKLYEIDAAIEACIDAETGEIVDVTRLDALQMERGAKVEGVALYAKNMAAFIAGAKAEEAALAQRRKAAENRLESLKNYLAYALCGEKLETPRVRVSYRTSEAVDIHDAQLLPRQFTRETVTVTPDKTAIRDALKAGEAVPGATIKKQKSVLIK